VLILSPGVKPMSSGTPELNHPILWNPGVEPFYPSGTL